MFARITLAAAFMMLMASYSLANEGIAGSAHDFTRGSNASWSDGEICKPCHTPHNAISADVTRRLWNHTLSSTVYTLHGTATTTNPLTGAVTETSLTGQGQDRIDALSRLCLSCHDGTVALDSFGGKTGSTFIGGSVNLGTDLSNDHPIGLNAEYKELSGVTIVGGVVQPGGHYRYQDRTTVANAGLRLVSLGSNTLASPSTDPRTGVTSTNKVVVGCTTCHDVHNGAGFEENLLRGTNAGSALCVACHTK